MLLQLANVLALAAFREQSKYLLIVFYSLNIGELYFLPSLHPDT
jgi:hypothetical protein